MTPAVTCPNCLGKGYTFAHVRGIRDGKTFSEFRDLVCSTCFGDKVITADHQARITKGERRREDRKARGLSLREEAKRLGISPVELSDIENGRVPETTP